MSRYRGRNLQWMDIVGRFEAKPSSTHLCNALGLLEMLSDKGKSFWDRDSEQFRKWHLYSFELRTFLKNLRQRREVEEQPLEIAMREFVQEFEHSTLRMHQMLYGAVADPESDERVKQMINWFNLIYLSSTYALLSAWIDDKQESNSLTTIVDLTTGEVRQEGDRTEMRVPRKYRRATKGV